MYAQVANNIYTSIPSVQRKQYPVALKPNKQFSKNATKYYTGLAPAKLEKSYSVVINLFFGLKLLSHKDSVEKAQFFSYLTVIRPPCLLAC
jgi:hypothetical protein